MHLKAFLDVLYQELFQGSGAVVWLEAESCCDVLHALQAGLGAGSACSRTSEGLSWKLCLSRLNRCLLGEPLGQRIH